MNELDVAKWHYFKKGGIYPKPLQLCWVRLFETHGDMILEESYHLALNIYVHRKGQKQHNGKGGTDTGGAEVHYPTMTLKELKKLKPMIASIMSLLMLMDICLEMEVVLNFINGNLVSLHFSNGMMLLNGKQ